MKRILSILCCLAFSITLCGNISTPATATTASDDEEMFELYTTIGDALWTALSSEEYYMYVNLMNNTFDDVWLDVCVEMTEEELSKERYIEILVNLMTLMELNAQEMIENQVSADTLKTFEDYVVDATGIVVEGISLTSAFGSRVTEMMNTVSSTMNIVWGAAGVTINSIEEYKYLDRVLKNYSQYHNFLTAIAKYGENPTLTETATELTSLTDKILYCKMNAVISQSEETAKYLGSTVFVDNILLEDMLKNPSILDLSEEEVSALGIFKKTCEFLTVLEFSKDVTIFISDIFGGFSDCMNRYSEMRALYEMRNALISDISNQRSAISSAKDTDKIKNVCSMLRQLLYLNYRGEYCMYEMMKEDGGIFSLNIKLNGEIQTCEAVFEFRKNKTIEYEQWLDVIMLEESQASFQNNYLQDALRYHRYLTDGWLEEEIYFFDKNYVKIETCLVDINDDGVYELLLSITDTGSLEVRGYTNKSFLFGIQNSEVVVLKETFFGGGSMGGYYLKLLYDTKMQKNVIVFDGYDRLSVFDYYSTFEAYSYNSDEVIPYFSANYASFSLDNKYNDEAISNVKKETPLYYQEDYQLYYYQIDEEYVSEAEYEEEIAHFTEPTDSTFVLKEGTVQNPLGLSQSELLGEPENNKATSQTVNEQNVIDAINDLLVGVTTQSGKISNWSEKDVYNYIYAKLLWDRYGNTNSRLKEMGLICRNSDKDYYDHYDLHKVEKVAQDAIGRSLPANGIADLAFVSGDEFLIQPATGECTVYSVQSYSVQGDELAVIGTVIHYGGYASISGYFEAVVKENPSSIYGYTLVSIEEISGNQDLTNLTATASSVLENSNSYCAPNAVDGNEKTAWVEGAYGDGIGEWIKISTVDSSKVEISVIELQLGYHKSYSLWEQNGRPTSVLLEFEDGTEQTADVYYIDAVVLDKPVKTSWVKITILDAKAGSVYSDTCISEIILYGLKT